MSSPNISNISPVSEKSLDNTSVIDPDLFNPSPVDSESSNIHVIISSDIDAKDDSQESEKELQPSPFESENHYSTSNTPDTNHFLVELDGSDSNKVEDTNFNPSPIDSAPLNATSNTPETEFFQSHSTFNPSFLFNPPKQEEPEEEPVHQQIPLSQLENIQTRPISEPEIQEQSSSLKSPTDNNPKSPARDSKPKSPTFLTSSMSWFTKISKDATSVLSAQAARLSTVTTTDITDQLNVAKKVIQDASLQVSSTVMKVVSGEEELKDDSVPKPNFMNQHASIGIITNVATNAGRNIADSTKRVFGSEAEDGFDYRIIHELSTLLSSGTFFYSDEYDITNTIQKSQEFDPEIPRFIQFDSRFFWNEYILDEFISNRLYKWTTCITQGFIEMKNITQFESVFDFVLISRRSKLRAGVRYERRGANEVGDAANYVVTEQIVYINDNVSSFVQTRGSIPLLWTQPQVKNQVKRAPVIEKSFQENLNVAKRHFDRQCLLYSTVTVVNLVDQHGREEILGGYFGEIMGKLNNPKVNYFEFDFHEHCKTFDYSNLSMLREMVEDELMQKKFFWKVGNEILTEQQGICLFNLGVIRTNCMDCLDRTNVVQLMFGKVILIQMLEHLGIRYDGADTEFDQIFKQSWANNGDYLSHAYTGTGALKSDFTRTGNRSVGGIIRDASNSVTRMYINQFEDSFKQGVIDVLLGNRFYKDIRLQFDK